MLTYTALKDKIESMLQDPANANFDVSGTDTAELGYHITNALQEVSDCFPPHIVALPFSIESRTGTATATTSNALVDTTESQFLSTDGEKAVYNVTDKTWARVTAYVSSSQLSISKDIMASGDQYKIFNAECRNNKQININSVSEYEAIIKAQYPVGTDRNVKIVEHNPKVIELVMDIEPTDSKALTSGSVQPDTEVLVFFRLRHKLSQLTDFVAAINLEAGYSAGTVSVVLDALQSSGTIEAGQEFIFANTRGTYIVDEAATISANAATVTFYPALQSSIGDNVVITFAQSSLTPTLENIVANLAAGHAALNKAAKYVNTVNVGSQSIYSHWAALGDKLLQRAERDLERQRVRWTTHDYPRT